ncbi:MAG: lysine--tRNA ligase [candidate division WOR-3 bacterium]
MSEVEKHQPCESGYEVRLEKLSQLRKMGVLPYAYHYKRTHTTQEVIEGFEELSQSQTQVSVAGRLISRRIHGKTQFGHIQDEKGKVQVYFRQDTLGTEVFKMLELLDIGDILGLRGEVFKTKTGEITIHIREWRLLAKSLRPLPEKFHGLRDIETRYRQRYLDLLVNQESKQVFLLRFKIVRLLQNFLDSRGFIEVETPILQPIYGGAAARPFQTYYNVLEKEFFLRISDELYLKRLIVGGLEKVYEIGKDFRNEGLDRFHNPEFTQLELYQAYADYQDMMGLVEEMFKFLALGLYQRTEIDFAGQKIDFGKPWQRLRFVEALEEKLGVNPLELQDEELYKIATRSGIEINPKTSRAKVLDKLFSELVQDKIVQPTFVIDHPKETTPLAKSHRDNPRLVERFEPVVCGMELGNAFSELNDPLEQRVRFEEGMKRQEEFATLDEDYCLALEYGMPPTGGLGIGIDRLVMLFTNQDSIRDVILFPQLKTESRRQSADR